jgi:hypothetical protein
MTCPSVEVAVALALAVTFVALLAFVLGGWHVATTKTYSRRQVASIAVATVLLHTLQVLTLIADNVPFPSTLQQVLNYLGFFVFQVDTTRPECLPSVTMDLPNKARMVLFGVPAALMCGYMLHCIYHKCRNRDHSFRPYATALLANVYWIWLALLGWSYLWLSCSEFTDGALNATYPALNADNSVVCFQSRIPQVYTSE